MSRGGMKLPCTNPCRSKLASHRLSFGSVFLPRSALTCSGFAVVPYCQDSHLFAQTPTLSSSGVARRAMTLSYASMYIPPFFPVERNRQSGTVTAVRRRRVVLEPSNNCAGGLRDGSRTSAASWTKRTF